MAPSLPEKILVLHQVLDDARLPHAFGGALALAYCTRDPRGTHDIDVNVFVDVERSDEVLVALPSATVATAADERALRRDGQVRVWWDGTPIDLFLANHPFHDQAERRVRAVPFAGCPDLPVLACRDLAVFKAFFARPKDAVDIATMVEADALDGAELIGEVADLLGREHPSVDFARRAVELADRS